MNMKWEKYDPTWLVDHAKEQHPDKPWLAKALSKCARCSIESKAYIHFVDPKNANSPGAEWQFEKNIFLNSPREGELVLDILEGYRVGGVEFLLRL